ncbi:hypothetical protein [Pontixanthobacter sp.]|uniref:hypothetical protein n=1 Tax=Pontixanthobacter sp. TaxID=2792078 RepID=UPI003C7E0DF8
MTRFIGSLFLGSTFLAGITIGTVEIALLNCVVFLTLALLALTFIPERWGEQGVVYSMAMSFFLSLFWPYALIGYLSGEDCQGDDCLAAPELAAPAARAVPI